MEGRRGRGGSGEVQLAFEALLEALLAALLGLGALDDATLQRCRLSHAVSSRPRHRLRRLPLLLEQLPLPSSPPPVTRSLHRAG